MKLTKSSLTLKFQFLLIVLAVLLLSITSCSKPKYEIGVVIGTLIDGNGNTPQTNKLILINNGKIEAIKDANEKSNYDYITFIDAKDKYIIPGLYDMHGHLTMSYRTFTLPNGIFQSSVEYNQQAAEWSLRSLLYYGITSVRETADFLEEGIELKKALESGKLTGPKIFTCGPLLESSPSEFKTMSVVVNSPEEARAEIRREVNAGVDFIKIYATVPPQILKAIIEEAHKHNKKVIGHLGASTWREAVNAGIDALVHPGPFCDKTLTNLKSDSTKIVLQLIAKNQIANDPTLIVIKGCYNINYGDSLIRAYPFSIPTAVRKSWEKENEFLHSLLGQDYDFQKEYTLYKDYTKAAYSAGVKLLVGSDFNNENVIPGYSLHQELKLMAEAGIPNQVLIKMATHDAAEWLGVLNESGTIEKGKRADLIILNMNPIQNISNTLQIDKVIFKGNLLMRDSLLIKN